VPDRVPHAERPVDVFPEEFGRPGRFVEPELCGGASEVARELGPLVGVEFRRSAGPVVVVECIGERPLLEAVKPGVNRRLGDAVALDERPHGNPVEIGERDHQTLDRLRRLGRRQRVPEFRRRDSLDVPHIGHSGSETT
jgi:hypothetical protein